MATLRSCSGCRQRILFGGVQAQGQRFCSRQCRDYRLAPDFCQDCKATTSADSGSHAYVGLFPLPLGLVPLGWAEPCKTCASRVQTRWLFVVVPLVPLRSHRIKWASKGRFLQRRLHGRRLHMAQVLRTGSLSVATIAGVVALAML